MTGNWFFKQAPAFSVSSDNDYVVEISPWRDGCRSSVRQFGSKDWISIVFEDGWKLCRAPRGG